MSTIEIPNSKFPTNQIIYSKFSTNHIVYSKPPTNDITFSKHNSTNQNATARRKSLIYYPTRKCTCFKCETKSDTTRYLLDDLFLAHDNTLTRNRFTSPPYTSDGSTSSLYTSDGSTSSLLSNEMFVPRTPTASQTSEPLTASTTSCGLVSHDVDVSTGKAPSSINNEVLVRMKTNSSTFSGQTDHAVLQTPFTTDTSTTVLFPSKQSITVTRKRSSSSPLEKDSSIPLKLALRSKSPESKFNRSSPESLNNSSNDSTFLSFRKNNQYICVECNHSFTWFGNFQKHMLSHDHDKTKLHPYFNVKHLADEQLLIREDKKTFKCRLCLKVFSRMSGYRTHVRMHNGQRPFKCFICPCAFTNNNALKMHMRVHFVKRPFNCIDCSKTFTRKDELQAHTLLHKGEKPFKCTQCTYASVRFGHLKRHKLTHATDKPYKCKSCPKEFTQYRNLQSHIYTHTGERPYKCRYCGKGFTQSGTVQAHERKHTGEKPYACLGCDKTFITSSHLRWHKNRHHKEIRNGPGE